MRVLGFIAGALATGLLVWGTGVEVTTRDVRVRAAASVPAPGPLVAEAGQQPGSGEDLFVPAEDHGRSADGSAGTESIVGAINAGADRADIDSMSGHDGQVLPPAGSLSLNGATLKDDPAPVGEEDAETDVLPGEPRLAASEAQDHALASAVDSGAESPTGEADAPRTESGIELATRVATDLADTGPDAATGDEEQWLGFFTPFRSEASARGFAQHLEAATGRQFRVARAGPGDYRVEFRLVPAEDRSERIAEIEAASGLALRAGQL